MSPHRAWDRPGRARRYAPVMATPEVGAPAPDLSLLRGEAEETVRLSDYWRRQPTVVVFLRHFG